MADGQVDAILTDPPYSSGGLHAGARRADPAQKYQASGTKRTYPPMLGDCKDQRSFTMWATLWLSECWRLAKPGAPVLVFSDWRQLPVMTDAIQAAGFEWRGIVVWHKPSARPMLGSFRRDAEFVIHAVKAPARTFTRRCFPGVFNHAVNAAAKIHLTSKPLPLLVDLLGVVVEGGTVLDPFMGGGTTAVACIETERRFVGVELSSEYASLAAERIAAVELAHLKS
ncbi:DNA-methyltransferase [Desulfovibrio sp. TomC]|uniref:DNA-methyltransferase n=1 Tax=Desulfovibrio sp. TomC TaxID=1562888 RepID=UPI0009E4D9F1|nr:DNA methyltransferase [Desulfovibrio sp. TomC]